MAITSGTEPQPVLIALPDADRKQVHIVLRHPLPEMRAGKGLLLDVQLRNDSSQAISSDYPQRVFLAYHWVKEDGSYDTYDGRRTALPATLEDPDLDDPAERLRRFGHPYHFRIYGADLPQRIAAAGFAVRVLDSRQVLSGHRRRRFRINRNHVLLCTRLAAG